MKMQERIALTMYEVHKLFYADMVDEGEEFPDFKKLDIAVRAYWLALADCAMECIVEPDKPMVDALLASMRKPAETDAGNWNDQHTAAFLKHLSAFLNGARIIAK